MTSIEWTDETWNPTVGCSKVLEPHEIADAMAFPGGYIPSIYTKRDRVKLAGNAVTPPVMAWICGRLLQALEATP